MTHEYTLLVGGLVLASAADPPASAIAWAEGVVLAVGSDAEIRAISRGDSSVIDAGGAFVLPLGPDGMAVWPPTTTIEIGGPADLALFEEDPRVRGARPEPVGIVRAGRVVRDWRGTTGGGRHMADFGLTGGLGSWNAADPVAAFREIVEPLPEVFTTLWLSDHLQQDREPWPEGWTRLTYLAAAIPRFRYGHLVLSQSYRNPGLLAAMAATLQKASCGRFILGLGAGWLEEEYRAFDFDYPSGGTRVSQLAEAIEIIRALWTGEPATYRGESYRIENAVCERPDPPIPILIGTNGPKALEVTARLADWWNWDGPWDRSYRRPYEQLEAACAEIGRPIGEITLTASLSVSMPDDPLTFEPTYTHDFYPGQVFGNVGPTAADVIREIEILVDHDVRHLQLAFDSPRELRRFVEEVVPHVRLERRSEL